MLTKPVLIDRLFCLKGVYMEIIAEKTLQAIESQLASDNGKRFKELEEKFLPTMHDAYKADKPNGLRDHLGASIIGEPCLRKTWLSYRGCGQSTITPRLMRLFNRGHLEEARFHAMLQASGVQTFWEYEGRQYGYKDGMFAGSIDGLALNVPDCPNELVMLEFKTMNDSRFKQFVSSGMLAFKGYENQCKINMYCMCKYQQDVLNQINPDNATIWNTLFIAVNKNTDDIHAVIIHRDDDYVEKNLQKRINAVLDNTKVPVGLHNKPTFFECKCCSFKEYCYENKELPHNCRTCQCHDLTNNGCIFDLNEYNNKCYTQIKVEMTNE